MTNVIKFTSAATDREKIREQACRWLAQLEINPNGLDAMAFNAWVKENPEHLEVLREMADLWDQMSVLSELSEVFPLAHYSKQADRSRRWKGVRAIAASLALVAAGVLGLNWTGGMDDWGQSDTIAQEGPVGYETRIGQQSTVTLPDGSVVVLNTDSLLEVAYTSDERHVYLKRGEALFTVTRDTDRPFRVFAGQRVVEAVGTAFSVQHILEESVEVIVTEGKVNFRSVGASMENAVLPLEAGEFAAVAPEASEQVTTGVIQPDEIEARLAWQHGMLLFQGDPLEEVLREFGRYTTIKLEAAEAIRDVRVQGYYRAGDVERLLIGIRSNFPIDVQKINETHFILVAR